MDEWEDAQERSREEAERALQQQRRGPTQAERACIDLLEQFLRDLDSSLADVVLRDVSYLIAETDALLGAWQRSRGYKCREIYLAAKLFCGPLRTAFATLLHEASHLFGTDGSRGFTDSLTSLVERIFVRTRRLRAYKKTWMQLRKQVQAERIALVSAASPTVLPPAGTAGAVFQTLASAPRHIANEAILRYVCFQDSAVAQIICNHGADEESLMELVTDLDDKVWATKTSPLEEQGLAVSCQPVRTPQPDQPRPAQPLSTSTTPSIAATVSDGATAA